MLLGQVNGGCSIINTDEILERINQINVKAYMHNKYDHCVSIDSSEYSQHRELVLLEDVINKLKELLSIE